MKPFPLIPAFLVCVLLAACTGYQSRYVAFRAPDAYPNAQQVNGLTVAGEAFVESKAAQEAFGFDIRGAGVLPVQLVLDNRSGTALNIASGQTFLIDDAGGYWPVIPNVTAVDRIEKSTQLAAFFGSGAGKGATVGGAGGALLGAALGIVSGSNVIESLGKGAVIGAAGGAVVGGASEGTAPDRKTQITNDLRNKGLEGKELPPDALANGFLFFPGEATSASELRLQLQERGGATRLITLPLH